MVSEERGEEGLGVSYIYITPSLNFTINSVESLISLLVMRISAWLLDFDRGCMDNRDLWLYSMLNVSYSDCMGRHTSQTEYG